MNSKFKTNTYEGAWIPFDGDRRRFRLEVQEVLRSSLNDSGGRLEVSEKGPVWIGEVSLAGLSYSQTSGWGLLVFSKSHSLGVDIERQDRTLKKNYLNLSERFFHPMEVERLKKASVFDGPRLFIDLWMKKEAVSKLKRVHLVKTISLELNDEIEFLIPSKLKENYLGVIAISKAD